MSEPSWLIDPKVQNPGETQGTFAGLSGRMAEENGPGDTASLTTHPDSEVRPFTGFDRERAAYVQRKHDLLSQCEGQFVVIVGDEIEGPLTTFVAAETAGYRRFGFGPLYIKQVLADEPIPEEVSRDIDPCRP